MILTWNGVRPVNLMISSESQKGAMVRSRGRRTWGREMTKMDIAATRRSLASLRTAIV